jgi:hypothetical protein
MTNSESKRYQYPVCPAQALSGQACNIAIYEIILSHLKNKKPGFDLYQCQAF